jgi:hypothetical protein
MNKKNLKHWKNSEFKSLRDVIFQHKTTDYKFYSVQTT